MAEIARRRVALVGAGPVASCIARRLLDAGCKLSAHIREIEGASSLLEHGTTLAQTPSDAVRQAEVCFTCMETPEQVEEAYLGSEGVLEAAHEGAYLVDLTPGSPTFARELHDAAEVMNLHFFDCPCTGGLQAAREGALTLSIGATEAYAAPVLPLLEAFSSRRFYFDEPGAGQTARLCAQVAFASCAAGAAELMALAEQTGVSAARAMEMASASMGASEGLARLVGQALEGDYAPGTEVGHLRRDLSLALEVADDAQVTLPATESAYNLTNLLCQVGGARLGAQALALLYADEAACAAAGLDWSLVREDPAPSESPARQRYYTGTRNL